MAQFELNIYGENDEILKTYETDHIRYVVFMQAQKLSESLGKNATMKAQLEAANTIVKAIFHGLTDDELMLADAEDVLSTFAQATRKADRFTESTDDTSKN